MNKRDLVRMCGLVLALCLARNVQALSPIAYTSSSHATFAGIGDIAVDASDNILIAGHTDGASAIVTKYDNNMTAIGGNLTFPVPVISASIWSSALDVDLNSGNISLATDAFADGYGSSVVTVDQNGTHLHSHDLNGAASTTGGAYDNDGDFWTVATDWSYAPGSIWKQDLPGWSGSGPFDGGSWNLNSFDWDHTNNKGYVGGDSHVWQFDPSDISGTMTAIAVWSEFGNSGTFTGNVPGLAVRHGRIYASDPGNSRINIFEAATGAFIQELSLAGANQLAVDSIGNIFVNDVSGSGVTKFTTPEPTTLLLGVLGVIGLLMRRQSSS